LTTWHGLKEDVGYDDIIIKLPNARNSIKAKIIKIDIPNDFALLEFTPYDYEAHVIDISQDAVSLLDDLYIIGNPLVFTNFISTATVANLSVNDTIHVNDLVGVCGSINSGSSGGMVLNSKGELVGIVQSKISVEKGTGIGFITKLETINEFLQK